MAEAKVNITINVNFGEAFKLIEEYLAQLPEGDVENASKTLENFVYWLLKRDTKAKA